MSGHTAPGAITGDILAGGDESDTYFISDDLTRVSEEAGEGGWDQVVTDRDFTLSQHTNGAGQASEIEKVQLWYAGDNDVDMSAASWDTEVYGNDGANTLTGGAAADGLYGGAGDDVLYGNGGDDYLLGEAGNDSIFGGDGIDIIAGGAGDDILSGGAGADEFHFDHAEGAQYDTITDFETGVDKIFVTDVDMWNFSISQTAEGTELRYGVDRTILIEDTVQMSDFSFLSGDTGGGGGF